MYARSQVLEAAGSSVMKMYTYATTTIIYFVAAEEGKQGAQ